MKRKQMWLLSPRRFCMKPKMVIRCAVAVLFLLQIALALPKPDFSGTWVMDVNRSFSNPPGLEQTLMVVHAQRSDQNRVEAKDAAAG